VQGVFIGVDLAWDVDRRHTGIAVMQGSAEGVRLHALSSGITSLAAVTQLIGTYLGECMMVAVDASLIVRNQAGQRPCEQAIGRAFGRHGASCHSSNRARPHYDSGERLVRSLGSLGFRHALPLEGVRRRPGRWLAEVYPHPAMVRLFGLERIIAYKKGTVGQRRSGLRTLQGHLWRLAMSGRGLAPSPCLRELLETDPGTRGGMALKQLEDLLDATLCAYLAWHIWRWGRQRNEVYGDDRTGYIVVPKESPTGRSSRRGADARDAR
jgi:predicted RNase H-like nuclease